MKRGQALTPFTESISKSVTTGDTLDPTECIENMQPLSQ
jgi:hypothetical protein